MEFIKDNIIPGEVIVQLFAFLIVFFSLRAAAWGPVQKALASRREKIKSDLDKIEDAKKEIEKLRHDYTQHLQQIDDEARGKLQEAIDEGRRIAKEIQEKARTESQSTFEKAKENLSLEVAKARLTLRREIADLAVMTSERILKEKMGGQKEQEAKVMSIIEELEKEL